jgi:hypothetical protein
VGRWNLLEICWHWLPEDLWWKPLNFQRKINNCTFLVAKVFLSIEPISCPMCSKRCNRSDPLIGIYWGSDWNKPRYRVLGSDQSLIRSQFIKELISHREIRYGYPVSGLISIQYPINTRPTDFGYWIGISIQSQSRDRFAREIQFHIFRYVVLKNWSNLINWPIPYQIGSVSSLVQQTKTHFKRSLPLAWIYLLTDSQGSIKSRFFSFVFSSIGMATLIYNVVTCWSLGLSNQK